MHSKVLTSYMYVLLILDSVPAAWWLAAGAKVNTVLQLHIQNMSRFPIQTCNFLLNIPIPFCFYFQISTTVGLILQCERSALHVSPIDITYHSTYKSVILQMQLDIFCGKTKQHWRKLHDCVTSRLWLIYSAKKCHRNHKCLHRFCCDQT